jgi:hypothetical protein
MTYTIFLHEERIPFLLSEMPYGKVKVIKSEDHKPGYIVEVEITIDDNFDLVKVFHAGLETGLSLSNKMVSQK